VFSSCCLISPCFNVKCFFYSYSITCRAILQASSSYTALSAVPDLYCCCCAAVHCAYAHLPSRPQALLQFVHGTRQQLLRSAAILHDPRKFGALAQLAAPNSVLDIAAQHTRHLQTAADELFKTNEVLRTGRVPLFNIPSALDVLSTGQQLQQQQFIHEQ
jgi:hypothetical protein